MNNPAAPGRTWHPVNQAYGYKQESDIDLVVPLQGRDFTLVRNYMSSHDPQISWFATNWQLNVGYGIMQASSGSDAVLSVSSLATGSSTFVKNVAGTKWLPTGPTMQYIEADELPVDIGGGGTKNYPVYKLVDPGQCITYYGRIGSGSGGSGATITANVWPDGAVLQVVDWYENTKTFKYAEKVSGNSASWRLDQVVCKPNGGGGNDGAIIAFDWYSMTYGTVALRNRLQQVRVRRYDGSSWQDVQKVEYTYETTSTACGTPLDLLQVIKSTLIDHGDWHKTITQYRYHDVSVYETGTDTDTDGFATERGANHQLKAVILPQQMEYAAELYNANPDPMIGKLTLEGYANHLLTLEDGDTAYGSTVVMALAAKVINLYENGTSRVLEQHVQASCGCGGSAQSVKYVYSYLPYIAGSGDYYTSTMKMEEHVNGSLLRTHLFDSKAMAVASNGTTLNMRYVSDVVVHDVSNYWVTHYEYDTNSPRRLIKVYSPSAVTAYTPGVALTSVPDPTLSNSGLIHEYAYGGNNRVTDFKVNDGDGIYAALLVTRTTWNATYPWLVDTIETQTDSSAGLGGSPNQSKIQNITFNYQFHGDTTPTTKPSWIETVIEAETQAEGGPNASGTKYYSHEYYSLEGLNTFSRYQDDSLVKRTFNNDTGAIATLEENAASTTPVTTTGLNGTFGNGDGGSLLTTYAHDLLGRLRTVISPSQVVTRYVRELAVPMERNNFNSGEEPYLALTVLPHKLGSSVFDGPAEVSIVDAKGDVIQHCTYAMSSSSTYDSVVFDNDDPYGYAPNTGSLLSRSTLQQHLSGTIDSTTEWHSIAGHGDFSGKYVTEYEFDGSGNLERVKSPSGTITQYTYDVRDRLTSVSVGTSYTSMANDLTMTHQYFYDSGGTATSGVGDGNLTLAREHTGESGIAYRDTKYTYDYRNRLIKVENPAAPHAFMVYDHLDRPIKVALFAGALPSSDIDDSGSLSYRAAYMEMEYSQRGLPYLQKVKVDPNTTSGDYLATYQWFDKGARVIAKWSPNGPTVKTAYDGLGRVKAVYMTDRGGDAMMGSSDNYDHAAGLEYDVVFEQVNYNYIDGDEPDYDNDKYLGLNDRVTHRRRAHDTPDAKTGDLAAFPGVGDEEYVITTYEGHVFDTANRVIREIKFGTNKTGFEFNTAAAPDIEQDAPLNWNSGDNIVSHISYNNRGLPEIVTNSLGRDTKMLYDDLGRSIITIENFKDAALASPPWDSGTDMWEFTGINASAPEEDRVTATVFLIHDEQEVREIAYTSDTGGQITRYVFDADKPGSPDGEDNLINSNDLLTQIIYPDTETTESDHSVYMSYNRLGDVRFSQDQATTKHEFLLDALGRITVDKATNFGSNIDDTIDAIRTVYNSLGQVQKITSNDGYSNEGSQGTIKNAVEFEYTDLWQVEKVWQQHDGNTVISGGGTLSPKVTYAYGTVAPTSGANGSNYSRLTSITYPNGPYQLPYEYGTAGTAGERISRVMRLDIHGGDDGAEYEYIGLALPAKVELAGPSGTLDVMLTRFHTATGTTTTGKYPGMDRFGRVQRHLWADIDFDGMTATPRLVDLSFTHDKGSNLLTADNTNDILSGFNNRDWKYTHDELRRLQMAERGKVASPFDHAPASSAYTASQAWTFDFLGNWKELITDGYGDGPDGASPDTTETREHSDANELTAVDLDGAGGADEFPIEHDKAGNIWLRQLTRDGDGYTKRRFTHDAWGRLVKVEHLSKPNGGSETVSVIHQAEYNGLTWRTVKKSDTTLVPDGLDQMRTFIYSAGWRMLEERIDTAWSSTFAADKIQQVIYGIRYIDDVICRRLDANVDGDYTVSGDGDLTFYHLTDNQFSTVAVMDGNANFLERVSYDPYGRPRHHRKADFTGDGTVNVADQLLVIGNWSGSGRGDANRDGVVNTADLLAVIGDWGAGEASGVLSSTTGNSFGFSGYLYDAELNAGGGAGGTSGGVYCVRFRHYDSSLGRWLERDPLGYVDGMSLYQYCEGMPLRALDPFGLTDDDYSWDELDEWIRREYSKYGIRDRRLPQDDNYTPDHGRADEGARLADLKRIGATIQEVATISLLVGGTVWIFLPGPDDGLIILVSGVKYLRRAGKWFRFGDDGALTPLDDALAKQLEQDFLSRVITLEEFAEKMKKAGFVQNPNRAGSWGRVENNKFKEYWQVDPATPGAPGWGGKDHLHKDGAPEHLPMDTPITGGNCP